MRASQLISPFWLATSLTHFFVLKITFTLQSVVWLPSLESYGFAASHHFAATKTVTPLLIEIFSFTHFSSTIWYTTSSACCHVRLKSTSNPFPTPSLRSEIVRSPLHVSLPKCSPKKKVFSWTSAFPELAVLFTAFCLQEIEKCRFLQCRVAFASNPSCVIFPKLF